MKNLEDKNKIKKFIFWLPILGIFFVSILLTFMAIKGIDNYFKQEAKKMEVNFKTEAILEARLKSREISVFADSLFYLIVNQEKQEMKNHITLIKQFANNLYLDNSDKSQQEMHEKIKCCLKKLPIKKGYIFLIDLSGKVIFIQNVKELEGKNLLSLQDAEGKFVIKDTISIINEYGKGMVYWKYKAKNGHINKKIAYVELFKPLNLIFGYVKYNFQINRKVKKEFVKYFSKMKNNNFEHHKVILNILNSEGIVIYSENSNSINDYFSDTIKFQIFLQKATKFPKDAITYEFKDKNGQFKQGIIRYNKKADIFIVEDIDTTILEDMIKNKKDKIDGVVAQVYNSFIITSLLVILLTIIIEGFFLLKVNKIFTKYEKRLIQEREKAKESEKIKSEFLANMSHEIRTPLNAMFGFIQILQQKDYDEETHKFLDIIEKSGNNLLTIINDILDFSKIESGKLTIEKVEFNPKEEIEIIYNLFMSKASEKNILLSVDELGLNWNIISDPTRIKQVIANLLSNAIKFTPNNKKVTLNVIYNENKQELLVEVRDEGIGISKNKIDKIFEPFSQADSSTTRKYGGTGLGLTISYKLIQLLGGELKVESKEGEGTSFYFSIPAQKKGFITEKVIKKEVKKEIETFNYHILVVEDNKANQMFMKVILKKLGLTFDIANNGKEAVEAFINHKKYDFILMDENMPIMNGIEATKQIRQIEKEKDFSHTIIVALTANALEGDKERFILAGMDYYLSKPLDIEKLKDILRRLT